MYRVWILESRLATFGCLKSYLPDMFEPRAQLICESVFSRIQSYVESTLLPKQRGKITWRKINDIWLYCTRLTTSMGQMGLLLTSHFINSRRYFWQARVQWPLVKAAMDSPISMVPNAVSIIRYARTNAVHSCIDQIRSHLAVSWHWLRPNFCKSQIELVPCLDFELKRESNTENNIRTTMIPRCSEFEFKYVLYCDHARLSMGRYTIGEKMTNGLFIVFILFHLNQFCRKASLRQIASLSFWKGRVLRLLYEYEKSMFLSWSCHHDLPDENHGQGKWYKRHTANVSKTGVIETFAVCRLYHFPWPWFSL